MPRSITKKAIKKKSTGAELAGEFDVLRLPAPEKPPQLTRLKIGLHISTSGGVEKAMERAYRLGCNTLQVFSSSPRMWRASSPEMWQCNEVRRLADLYQIWPMVIHTSYLVNMCSKTQEFLERSITAFRGELERGLVLGAKYLVLHPGSFSGGTREEGLARAVESIKQSSDKLDLAGNGFRILIENTAGAEYSLGGSFEQVAELLHRLQRVVPVAACIDTCHTHVAGYDVVTEAGWAATLAELEQTVGLRNVAVWHCNDAKGERGCHLDRHQHIGKGTIGVEPFRRLLNDPQLSHAAFIAETPIDEPGDDRRNVETLKSLVAN